MIKELDKSSEVKYPKAMELPCPRCGGLGALRIGQLNFRGQLKWFESVNCDKCGLRSEADGVGFPPPEIRKLFIENDGEWCVTMKDVHSTASVVKVLRSALSLDMKTSSDLLKAEAKVVFQGSRSESLWLVELLEAVGESPILSMFENNS